MSQTTPSPTCPTCNSKLHELVSTTDEPVFRTCQICPDDDDVALPPARSIAGPVY